MSLKKEEILEIAKQGLDDPVFFCKTFLPHLFPGRIPWVHRGLWAILTRQTDFLLKYGEVDKIVSNFVVQRSPKETPRPIFVRRGGRLLLDVERFTLIMLPRGFAKTTVAGVAATLRGIAYQDWSFLVYVSEASPHAEMQLGNVKRELETNERFRAVFGDLKPSNSSSKKWTEDLVELLNGQVLVARGRGGQIRGLNHSGRRPDRIIFDDLEDKESVATEAQRKKTKEWAFGDLIPALPELNPQAQMLGLGTLLHSDALLAAFVRDPQWLPIIFGARDRQGDLLWPENLDEKKLETKKTSYSLAGELNLYYLEYHNTYRDELNALFRAEFFKYAEAPNGLRAAIYCDPAISKKDKADEATIYVVGMSDGGKIYVLENWSKRGATPREIVDQYFDMAKRWSIDRRCHGFEGNGYQAALEYLLREEMFRKKYYFEPIKITNTVDKKKRIKGILQPRFAGGYVFFSTPCPKLETQLLDFENTVHEDHSDALAGAVALLDPFAASAADETSDLGKDEYLPLEEELGNWRSEIV